MDTLKHNNLRRPGQGFALFFESKENGVPVRNGINMALPKMAVLLRPAEKLKNRKRPAGQTLLAVVLAVVMVIAGIFAIRLHSGGTSGGTVSRTGSDKQIHALVQELLLPVGTAVGDGKGTCYLMEEGESFTAGSFKEKTSESLMTAVMQEFFKRGTRAETISSKQYRSEASGRTMMMEYSCSIPFELFLSENGLEAPGGASIPSVSSVVMTAEEGGTLYIYDGEHGDWYRVTGKGSDAVITDKLIRELTASAKERKGTRKASLTAGGAWSGLKGLVPAEASSGSKSSSGLTAGAGKDSGLQKNAAALDSYRFTPEFDLSQKTTVQEIEQLFFPQGLEFLQQVALPDGGRTYMYGSMETMLKIGADGSILFQQDTETKGELPDLYESLETAVRYIRNHGGWPGEQQDGVTVRLAGISSASSESGSQTDASGEGYRFDFELEAKGIPLVYESGNQMYVVVGREGVSEYYRDLPDLSEWIGTESGDASADSGKEKQNTTSSDARSAENGEKSAFSLFEEAELLSLQEVIKVDSDRIKTALADKGTGLSELSTEELQKKILNEISSAELQLLRIEDSELVFTAEDSSNRSEKMTSSNRSGSRSTESESDQKSEENTSVSERGLLPVWCICIHDTVFEISAWTGRLLQDL